MNGIALDRRIQPDVDARESLGGNFTEKMKGERFVPPFLAAASESQRVIGDWDRVSQAPRNEIQPWPSVSISTGQGRPRRPAH